MKTKTETHASTGGAETDDASTIGAEADDASTFDGTMSLPAVQKSEYDEIIRRSEKTQIRAIVKYHDLAII